MSEEPGGRSGRALHVPVGLPVRLCFAIAFVACLVATYLLARHAVPNADSVQSFNEMLAVRSGNLPLRHWVLGTDDYLLTDLLPMVVVSLLLGTSSHLIYLVPFIVWASLLATSVLIVRSVASSRPGRLVGAFAVLALLGMPTGLLGMLAFWSDFHVATITVCLLAVLTAAPALSSEAFRRRRLVPFAALVFAAAFSDPLADLLLVAPLCLLVAFRLSRGAPRRADEILFALSALGGAASALLATVAVARSGHAYAVLPNVTWSFVSTPAMAMRNLHALAAGLEILFNAIPVAIEGAPKQASFSVFGLLTSVAVAALSVSVLLRASRRSSGTVAQWLVLGALAVLAAGVPSATFAAAVETGPAFPGASIRFAVPPFVFLCLAAALEGADLAGRVWPRAHMPLLLAGLVLLVAQSATGATAALRAAVAPAGIHTGPDAVLADWLLRQGFTYGVGDYWDTQLVDAYTGGVVLADPLVENGGGLALWPWLTDTSRFRPDHRPQFAIIRPHGLFRVTLPVVTAVYGRPMSITEVAGQFSVARLGPAGGR